MAFGSFLFGSPAKSQQFSTLSPQQMGVKGAASSQAMNLLQNLGGGAPSFEPIAQRARTQFQTQTVPGLAERFTSLGHGAQRSSAFQGALGQAGAGLEEGLAALGSQYGLQKQGLDQQLLSLLLGTSLSPEVQTGITPEKQGLFGGVGSSIGKLLPILAMILGGGLAGPGGAAIGGAAGSGLNALTNAFASPAQSPSFNIPNYSSMISNVTGQQNPGVNLPDYNALIANIIGGNY